MSDRELEVIRRKRLQELKRHLERKTETEVKDEREENTQELLNRFFVDRAWEVLNAAKAQYPQAAGHIENTLVKLIREGKIKTQISGGELYGLFLHFGFRVHLQTRVTVFEHGKVKSLEDKIKEETSQ
jgi:DNA-binding TFAR19-related protein (PDSD5 family)